MSTTPIPFPSTFPLLALPAELRQQIFALLLTKKSGSGPIMDTRNSLLLKEGPYQRYRNIGGLGLLRVSKSVSEEAGRVLYEGERFVVNRGKEEEGGGSWFTREWVPGIGSHARFIRKLDVRIPEKWVE